MEDEEGEAHEDFVVPVLEEGFEEGEGLLLEVFVVDCHFERPCVVNIALMPPIHPTHHIPHLPLPIKVLHHPSNSRQCLVVLILGEDFAYELF